MKKLLLALICIGSILALPGCWCCRRTCEASCESYCDDYNDDYCDDGYCDGKELVGYEEQQGWRHNEYRERGTRTEGKKAETGSSCPVGTAPAVYKNKPTYHKPIHPGVMDHVEKTGKQIRYLDSRWADHNAKLQQKAEVKAQRKTMKNGGRVAVPVAEAESMR